MPCLTPPQDKCAEESRMLLALESIASSLVTLTQQGAALLKAHRVRTADNQRTGQTPPLKVR